MGPTYDKAVTVIETLRKAGYAAYFAGGWVRDYLLKQPSLDIDIATAAAPEVVIELFRHTVKVGVSFGVVMVIIDGTPFEVATFRKDGLYLYGRRPEAIEFSTAEEDAQRRDFTINGMFYDPLTGDILDYVGGHDDLNKGLVKAIGNAHERFQEDRLRMVRGVRIMARFHFSLERETRDAIAAHATALFPSVAKERVWQEFCKMAEHPGVGRALVTMHELGLLAVIFPELTEVPLEEIVLRTRVLKEFPHPCPTILSLAQLFPNATANDLEAVCIGLKASNSDAELASWYLYTRQMAEKVDGAIPADRDWVYFYADPRTALCLQVHAMTLPKEKRHEFLERHYKAQQMLSKSIQRVKERKPLVTARHLEQEGIAPGKQMGIILKAAERLAIADQLDDAMEVLERLKKTSTWPGKER